LSLEDGLLPKHVREEFLQSFNPGRQLLHLSADAKRRKTMHRSYMAMMVVVMPPTMVMWRRSL
jgi:hypothetical protein